MSIIICGIVYPLNSKSIEVSFGSTVNNLYTSALVNGKQKLIPCPNWDWTIVETQCLKDGYILNKYMISFNCLPRCGKYPGDKPDIGGYEYISNITSEKPWGDWNGIPLKGIDIDAPENFREQP